jgi:hypothetical protein
MSEKTNQAEISDINNGDLVSIDYTLRGGICTRIGTAVKVTDKTISLKNIGRTVIIKKDKIIGARR